MEIKLRIKLTITDSDQNEISLTPQNANAVLEDKGRERDHEIQLQSDKNRVKRIAVLRCGTVSLRNFTEDLTEPGKQLKLIREPDNPHDRWATKVCTLSGTMLGYLPARKNQSVARLMDAGKNITVFVDESLDAAAGKNGGEDPGLPLILYMDIRVPEEREPCEQV